MTNKKEKEIKKQGSFTGYEYRGFRYEDADEDQLGHLFMDLEYNDLVDDDEIEKMYWKQGLNASEIMQELMKRPEIKKVVEYY